MTKEIKDPRPKTLKTVSIVGIGSHAPEKILTNADLEKMVDTSDEWITTRTGMKERHIAADTETTSDIATKAAQKAMDSAGVKPEDIDMIILATITPDMVFPNTAGFVQHNLGAKNAFCMDIEAACSGFIYALEIGTRFVAAGGVKTALVIGAETLSKITDWEDRNTCVLFGDAAGAAILQATDRKYGILTTVLGSDGSLAELLMLPGGGSRHPATHETVDERLHYMKMSGREVFKHAVTKMTAAAKKAMKQCGLTIDDIACVVPHQANVRIIEAIGNRLGGGIDKYYMNIQKYGNTSAASIAVALDEASRSGRIKSGDLVLLIGFGGGFTWGASIVEWY